ncbi:MAG: hypothetical protein ACP5O7_03225 [Phycisphaerae bacterium]
MVGTASPLGDLPPRLKAITTISSMTPSKLAAPSSIHGGRPPNAEGASLRLKGLTIRRLGGPAFTNRSKGSDDDGLGDTVEPGETADADGAAAVFSIGDAVVGWALSPVLAGVGAAAGGSVVGGAGAAGAVREDLLNQSGIFSGPALRDDFSAFLSSSS